MFPGLSTLVLAITAASPSRYGPARLHPLRTTATGCVCWSELNTHFPEIGTRCFGIWPYCPGCALSTAGQNGQTLPLSSSRLARHGKDLIDQPPRCLEHRDVLLHAVAGAQRTDLACQFGPSLHSALATAAPEQGIIGISSTLSWPTGASGPAGWSRGTADGPDPSLGRTIEPARRRPPPSPCESTPARGDVRVFWSSACTRSTSNTNFADRRPLIVFGRGGGVTDAGNDGLVGVAKQAAKGDEGMKYIRLGTGDAAADVKKNCGSERPSRHARGSRYYRLEGVTVHILARVGAPPPQASSSKRIRLRYGHNQTAQGSAVSTCPTSPAGGTKCRASRASPEQREEESREAQARRRKRAARRLAAQ